MFKSLKEKLSGWFKKEEPEKEEKPKEKKVEKKVSKEERPAKKSEKKEVKKIPEKKSLKKEAHEGVEKSLKEKAAKIKDEVPVKLSGKAIVPDVEKLREELAEKSEEKKEIVSETKEKKESFFGKIKKAFSEEKKTDGVKITYFVHGTTLDNQNKISTGQAHGELSELGIKQSEELLGQIKEKDFDAVFCSDLKRAIDSAEISFKGKYKIIQDKRLRECNYGSLNQAPEEEVDYSKHIFQPFPNGESLVDVESRIRDFLNYLYKNYSGKHIAIVAHKAPQLAIEVLLNNKTWEESIETDWREVGKWRPGWAYSITQRLDVKELEEKREELEKRAETLQKEIEEEVVEKAKAEPEPLAAEEVEEEIEEKKGFFGKLARKLTASELGQSEFDEMFDELELSLLENNVALEVVDKIKEKLKEKLVGKQFTSREVEGKILGALKDAIDSVLIEPEDLISRIKKSEKPFVILFFGINGSGKTTSIAKLAYKLKKEGLDVVVAAGDTFRAASIEQLETHALRVGVDIVKGEYGKDPSAVAFDAIAFGKKNKKDVVLIDTAGRMYTKSNLMKEMEKIVKVSKPDLKIFVGESITGNDGTEQAKMFHETAGIDGIILSKADIDEKAGTILSVSYVTGKPIYFLGVGQEYGDLEVFKKAKVLEHLGLD